MLRTPGLLILGSVWFCATACTITTKDPGEDGTGGTTSEPGTGGEPAEDGGSGGGGTKGTGGASGGGAETSTGGTTDGTGGSADTGDDGGDGGDGTKADGGTIDAIDDSCTLDGTNDVKEKAMSAPPSFRLCLKNDDVDWLELTAPKGNKPQIAKIEFDQEASARLQVVAYAGADNSEIGETQTLQGTKGYFYVIVGGGTTTYLKLYPYYGDGSTAFRLGWTAEDDAYEPNQERAAAATAAKNTDITAQFLPRYVSTTDKLADDWYAVDLAVAKVTTVNFTHIPENVRFRVSVYGPTGLSVAQFDGPNPGALFTHTFTPDVAGTYRIGLESYYSDHFGSWIGDGTTPKNITDTYTLRVEQ
jgi:hypothetical protein